MTIPIAESGVTVTVPLQAWADAPLNETLENVLNTTIRKESTHEKNRQKYA